MAEDETVLSGGRTATEFRDIADQLRSRVDLFGKTLAAIATLGTTAVGLSKIGDLFPADGDDVWVVLACLGLAVAALAAIGVAVRLMNVARPIFLRADLDLEKGKELEDKEERTAVQSVFEAAAARFGYTSLRGLQERERSLRNAAFRATDKDERARRTALADEVKVEIEQALARGQVVVVRHRATKAVTHWRAWLLYGAFIVGLIIFAVGTDIVSSGRSDPIAIAKACGEARKAGATAGELARTNKTCDAQPQTSAEESKPPSAAEARSQIAAKLAATLEACTALVYREGDVNSGPLNNGDCDPVRKAVSAMYSAP